MPNDLEANEITTKEDSSQIDEGTVLVIDDEAYNIDLFKMVLSPAGYTVLGATSGKEGLNVVKNVEVDLIILDLMMPDINGYEVCRILKNDPDTRLIPILVVTALSGIKENIKIIDLGAEGFISKPFNTKLAAAYVKSLIKVKKLTDKVIKLGLLKDDLTKMIIHDLRNPLISALGFLRLSKKEESSKKKEWYSSVIQRSVEDAFELIENLHDITRLENDKLELNRTDQNIYLIITELIESMSPIFKKKGLLTKIVSDCDLRHSVDTQVFKRVVQNIFTNAVHHASENSTVIVHSLKKDDSSLVLRISNEGETISEDERDKVFEMFGQVELKQKGLNIGSGLGLAFCKMAIEAHNGKIWLESPAIDFDNGASFIFEIK